MLLPALITLPALLLAATPPPAPPPAAFDCAFSHGADWTGPAAIRLAFDFAAQTATVTGEGQTWTYRNKPGTRLAVVTTDAGAMGAVGDAGPGVSDTLMLQPNLSFVWIGLTAITESITTWRCRPAA